MNVRELNEKLVEMGKRPVNDSAEVFDPYGTNLRQQTDGKWVIAGSDGRGGVSYRYGPMKADGGADILTFETSGAACDYIWQEATAPRPKLEPSTSTPEEDAARVRRMIERHEAAVKTATETTKRNIRELNDKLVGVGQRPVNDWPVDASVAGFDPYALGLRQQGQGKWAIMIGDGIDGVASEFAPPTFATVEAACD
ncbi:hypothetical protein ABH924_004423 [Arthrobacter sp. GAS37]|uniref:hypothetical protein n=1 Tax=Arthrobacter sp. GAS37 TaxID=3156261 RepID=UPI003835CC29